MIEKNFSYSFLFAHFTAALTTSFCFINILQRHVCKEWKKEWESNLWETLKNAVGVDLHAVYVWWGWQGILYVSACVSLRVYVREIINGSVCVWSWFEKS